MEGLCGLGQVHGPHLAFRPTGRPQLPCRVALGIESSNLKRSSERNARALSSLGSQPTPSHLPKLGWERQIQALQGLSGLYPWQQHREGKGSWALCLLSKSPGQDRSRWEGGEPAAQLAWLGPQGPNLFSGDSRVQPDTRCRPPRTAVQKEKKQQAGFQTLASPESYLFALPALLVPGRRAEASFGLAGSLILPIGLVSGSHTWRFERAGSMAPPQTDWS